MFRRTIEINVVKKKDIPQDAVTEDDDFDKKLVFSSEVAKDIIREAFKLYTGYVVLDTCRKVLIALAERA